MRYERFGFRYRETIATVLAENESVFKKAVSGMMYARSRIEEYISKDPFFLISYEPLDCSGDVVERMCIASKIAGVGPMAAVAGTVAWYGVEFADSEFIAIDNGGDVVLRVPESIDIGIYSGSEIAVGIEIESNGAVKGVCTSSGRYGHSVSFGCADAVTVISENPSVADALATAIANMVKENFTKKELEDLAESSWNAYKKWIEGFVLIKNDYIILGGNITEIKPVKIASDLITRA